MAVSDSAVGNAPSRYSHPRLAEAIFALDARLRRRYAVVEYTRNPSCVFRLQIVRSQSDLVLRDGTQLRAGERVAQLHYWSEQIPPAPPIGMTIGWARQMTHSLEISWRELARYLAANSDLSDVAVIRADAVASKGRESRQLARIMAHYGFEAIARPEPPPIGERLHRCGENILMTLMLFAQNARAMRAGSLTRGRVPLFLSRRALEHRFGSPA
jgi:hypothetical protein